MKLFFPFISCHICYGKSEAKIFNKVIKVKLFISKAWNSSPKSMDFFPTNKTKFRHTEDFNQTTHVAPYEPIVLNDNLSYFNSLSFVQDVLKGSCHGHIIVILTWFSTHPEIFNTVFNMPWNFWHDSQYALKFSTHFQHAFNCVFSTPWNFRQWFQHSS